METPPGDSLDAGAGGVIADGNKLAVVPAPRRRGFVSVDIRNVTKGDDRPPDAEQPYLAT
jgi:hypothetical protein